MAETRDNSIPYTEVRVNPADFVNAPGLAFQVILQESAFLSPGFSGQRVAPIQFSRDGIISFVAVWDIGKFEAARRAEFHRHRDLRDFRLRQNPRGTRGDGFA